LLKYFPKTLGLFVSLIPQVLLLLWPFLDRSPERHPKKRRFAVTVGVAAVVLAVAFGVVGHLSESTITFHGHQYHFDVYGVPHELPAQAPH
jgi:quinol-cytochrome oxidoreductase complex cytochrome b subunit